MKNNWRLRTRNLSPQVIQDMKDEFKKVASGTYTLLVDFEGTCDKGEALPRAESEIIEVGAALVRNSDLTVVETFGIFIQPQIHPKLTDFCTELTTITQSDVDQAPRFGQAMRKLGDFLHKYTMNKANTLTWMSWGEYDQNILKRNAAMNNASNPLGPFAHVNLKVYEAVLRGDKKQIGCAGAVKHYGLQWVGQHHRGIDDAVNTANIYCELVRRYVNA